MPGDDPDVKAFFDGLNVQQHGDRTVLTAAIPPGFFARRRCFAAEVASEPAPPVLPPCR